MLALSLALEPAAASTQLQPPGIAERFAADAFRATANGWLARSALDIVVERWATDYDFERLGALLCDEGPGAFVEALRALGPSGEVHEYGQRPEVRRSWREFDAAFDLEDGLGRRRIIIVAADEDGGFWLVEMSPEPGGGTGRVAEYADVVFDRQTGHIAFEGLSAVATLERIRPVPLVPR